MRFIRASSLFCQHITNLINFTITIDSAIHTSSGPHDVQYNMIDFEIGGLTTIQRACRPQGSPTPSHSCDYLVVDTI